MPPTVSAETDRLSVERQHLRESVAAEGVAHPGSAGKVAFNSLIQSAGKLVGYASGLIIVSLTTRLLTTTGYGDYTIAVVYLSFVAVFADAGINLIGVREASKHPERLDQVFATAMSLKVVVSLLAYSGASVLILVLPYSREVKIGVFILGISMFFVSLGNGFDIVYQSRLQMQVPTLADLVLRVFTLVGTCLLFVIAQTGFVAQSAMFYAIIAVAAVANTLSFVVRWRGLRRVVRFRFHRSAKQWGPLLRMAVPMGIVVALGQIHYKADTILLSVLVSPRDVAVYGVAYKVVDFLLMFFGVFVTMAFPVLVRESSQTQTHPQTHPQAARRVLTVCLSIVLPAALGTFLLAPGMVTLIGGGQYAASAPALRILSLALIFSCVNMVYNYLIVVHNRQHSLIWVAVVAILANVALNLYAIPRYSYIGSAVATDVTEGLGMVLGIIIASRIEKVTPALAVLARIIVACAAMAVTVQLLEHIQALSHPGVVSTLLLASVGALVYGVVLVAIGGADEAMVRLVRMRVPVINRSRSSRTGG